MKIYMDVFGNKLDAELVAVKEEHARQLAKWGIQERTLFEWMTYLTEEVGELAQAISEEQYRDGLPLAITKEAIQVAALATRISAIVKQNLWNDKEAVK